MNSQVVKKLIVVSGGALDPSQTPEQVQLFDSTGTPISAITFDETPGAADVLLTAYVIADSPAAVADTDTANQAFGKIEKRVVNLEAHDTSAEIVITGYVLGTNAVVANTDTLNAALGKLQKQISDLDTRVDALEV